MLFNYECNSENPGIYKIVNNLTNRIYVGQASRFDKRWGDYKRGLTSGKNHNSFFLRDFNKCKAQLGHDDFLEFHVLEVMVGSTKEERNRREEYWIAQYWDKQKMCYNFKRQANANPRSKTAKWQKQMSDVVKLKMRQVRKTALINNPESMSSTISGRAVWAQNNPKRLKEITSRAGKISASKRAVTITLINPEDKQVDITNIAEYAREHGLQPEYLTAVWNGKKDNYKGWLRVGAIRKEVQEQSAKRHASRSLTWDFVDPTGKIVQIWNLRKFCKENNLSQSNMHMVANGKRKQHNGWTKPI